MSWPYPATIIASRCDRPPAAGPLGLSRAPRLRGPPMSPQSPAPAPAGLPLTTRTPWTLVGLSRMSWYRLLRAGSAPPPVDLGHARGVYLIALVLVWLESRPLAQR